MTTEAIRLERGVDASSPNIKVEIYDQAYTIRSDGDPGPGANADKGRPPMCDAEVPG